MRARRVDRPGLIVDDHVEERVRIIEPETVLDFGPDARLLELFQRGGQPRTRRRVGILMALVLGKATRLARFLSADDKTLFVDCFGDGKCRVFDVSEPQKPKQIYEKQIGKQVNMVSQSWDGKRVYFTSSLLAGWDKKGADNEQFLRAYAWDGKELKPKFDLDFTALKLGRPHHMLFGSTKLGPNRAVASN